MTIQKQAIDYIQSKGGKANGNDIAAYGFTHYCRSIDRRIRELFNLSNLAKYGLPDYKLISRDMTDNEMFQGHCKKRVKMYEIIPIEKPKKIEYAIKENQMIIA